jgi:hypothetical protein
MQRKPDINRSFRFTAAELESMDKLAHLLTEERRVFGLMTPKRGVNIAALVRYLVQEKLYELEQEKTKKST